MTETGRSIALTDITTARYVEENVGTAQGNGRCTKQNPNRGLWFHLLLDQDKYKPLHSSEGKIHILGLSNGKKGATQKSFSSLPF